MGAFFWFDERFKSRAHSAISQKKAYKSWCKLSAESKKKY